MRGDPGRRAGAERGAAGDRRRLPRLLRRRRLARLLAFARAAALRAAVPCVLHARLERRHEIDDLAFVRLGTLDLDLLALSLALDELEHLVAVGVLVLVGFPLGCE